MTPDGVARGVERTPGMRDYHNPKTFQIYSKGPNMKTCPNVEETWPDVEPAQNGHDRLGGTERDDIRNWEGE